MIFEVSYIQNHVNELYYKEVKCNCNAPKSLVN